MTHDNRSKTTVCADKFGVAVLPASVHASEQRASATFMSAIVHHSLSVRAGSGSVKPRRSSICPNVRTTLFAYLFSRVLVEQPVLPRLVGPVRLRGGRVCFGLVGLPRRALDHPLEYVHSTMTDLSSDGGTPVGASRPLLRRSYSAPRSTPMSNCTSEIVLNISAEAVVIRAKERAPVFCQQVPTL